MKKKHSYTYKLTAPQQTELLAILSSGTYKVREAPHTQIAVEGNECKILLYNSGKCLVQGKGSADWVSFVLEPEILKEASLGYEDLLNPSVREPHMGVDESGKGDFFGPLVIAAVFVNAEIVSAFQDMDVRDSKTITSDKKARAMATAIRSILKGQFSLVTIRPETYNRLYSKMRNVNKMLAWGHARAIENLLEKVPDCPRAISDQFGPTSQIERALLKQGKKIKLEQRPRAESDPAVAAASILARAAFLDALKRIQETYDTVIPKGASAQVKEAAGELIKKNGPDVLLKTAKCHFKTTDQVLEKTGMTRDMLGEDGQAVSKQANPG